MIDLRRLILRTALATRARARALRHPFTLGAQGLIVDEQNQVLLVRHTYAPGWHFPGGGVDPRESFAEALERELREEVGVTPEAPPELFGIYTVRRPDHTDHIGLFLVRRWTRHPSQSREIAEARFVPANNPPPEIMPGTRRRLKEWLGEAPRSPIW